jgi:predicted O-methyltransferase YrrM
VCYTTDMRSFPEVLELTKDVNALLCEEDKEALYFYARMVRSGGIIVDIGTAAGGSAFIMGLASKDDVTILTIDPMPNNNFQLDRKRLHLERKINYYPATSLEAYSDFTSHSVSEIDMLFIDGVHNYNGVKRDWETWGSRLKHGGFILFHDILLYPDIGKFVNDMVMVEEINPLRVVDAKFRDDPRPIGMFIGEKV